MERTLNITSVNYDFNLDSILFNPIIYNIDIDECIDCFLGVTYENLDVIRDSFNIQNHNPLCTDSNLENKELYFLRDLSDSTFKDFVKSCCYKIVREVLKTNTYSFIAESYSRTLEHFENNKGLQIYYTDGEYYIDINLEKVYKKTNRFKEIGEFKDLFRTLNLKDFDCLHFKNLSEKKIMKKYISVESFFNHRFNKKKIDLEEFETFIYERINTFMDDIEEINLYILRMLDDEEVLDLLKKEMTECNFDKFLRGERL